MARREGAASQQFAAEKLRLEKQAGKRRDELKDDCRRAPGAKRRVQFKGVALCWWGAVDRRTRWWSETGVANGVVVRRK